MIKSCTRCGRPFTVMGSCVRCGRCRNLMKKEIRRCKKCGEEFKSNYQQGAYCKTCSDILSKQKYRKNPETGSIAYIKKHDAAKGENDESREIANNHFELWTDSEVRFLNENKERMTQAEVAEILKRTIKSVGSAANRRKINFLTEDKKHGRVISYKKMRKYRLKKQSETRVQTDE